MKKYIYFLIIFITCNNIHSLESLININYSLTFDKEIKINGKNVIHDLSSDVLKYVRKFDSTEDMPKNSKIIYKDSKKDKYNEIENFLTESVFKKILKKNENQSNNFIINNNLNENAEYNADLIVFEYTEGEYNLIKNRNTIVKLLVKIYKKDIKNSLFLIKRCYYNCKSDINFPVELMRLDYISDRIADDFLVNIKKHLKIKIK